MLITPKHSHIAARSRQTGVTLVITLIVLVAMTLAAISLMRSVDTTNIIAGNLAFQQAAIHAADAGTEDAVNNLLPTISAAHHQNCSPASSCPTGYISWRDPLLEPPFVTWETFWSNVNASAVHLAADAYGNTVDYVVQTLCDGVGQVDPCVYSPPSLMASCQGSNVGAGNEVCYGAPRNYYRVTSRVRGPRNVVSYIQVIVAM